MSTKTSEIKPLRKTKSSSLTSVGSTTSVSTPSSQASTPSSQPIKAKKLLPTPTPPTTTPPTTTTIQVEEVKSTKRKAVKKTTPSSLTEEPKEEERKTSGVKRKSRSTKPIKESPSKLLSKKVDYNPVCKNTKLIEYTPLQFIHMVQQEETEHKVQLVFWEKFREDPVYASLYERQNIGKFFADAQTFLHFLYTNRGSTISNFFTNEMEKFIKSFRSMNYMEFITRFHETSKFKNLIFPSTKYIVDPDSFFIIGSEDQQTGDFVPLTKFDKHFIVKNGWQYQEYNCNDDEIGNMIVQDGIDALRSLQIRVSTLSIADEQPHE